jgi:hypothetical protein
MLAMKPGLGLPTVGLSGIAPAAAEVEIAVQKSAARLARAAPRIRAQASRRSSNGSRSAR